jgi:hypothetical protein
MRVNVMPMDSKWIVKRESSDEILASHCRKDKAVEKRQSDDSEL